MLRIALSLALFFQTQSATDPWQPLRFLIGTWDANGGEYSFNLELAGKVLVRHSSNGEHHDILYIYPEDKALKAIYFDTEGHVIHYDVSTTPETAIFEGGQYRLSYQLKDGVMSGKFEVGGKQYLQWSGRKK